MARSTVTSPLLNEMKPLRPWVVVGNPENRRIALFQDALASRGLQPADVTSYHDLLTGRASLKHATRGAIVRIDSPGENFAVEKLLLAAGESAAEAEGGPVISRRQLAKLGDDRGRILFPRQWYLGFARTLAQWQAALDDRDDVRWTSQPADIAVMFDKAACHRRCASAEVTVPPPLGAIAGFDELHARMEEHGLQRVFVKLAHSSSASGVAAVYHSLKLRRYVGADDVRQLVDALAVHRVHAEQWLPKAALGGRVCDLRVVTIAGAPRHLVVRTSRSPLTNLHLGNRRGNVEALLGRLPADARAALDATCRRAAACFPRTLHAGLDILFTPGFRQLYLLEVNAFGDLLPGVVHEGATTYEAQVDACRERACGAQLRG
jgi:hypothetical protein